MNRAEVVMRAHRASDEDVARLVLEAIERLRVELAAAQQTCPVCHGHGQIDARREVA